MARKPIFVEFDRDDEERVLAPGRVRRFYLLFLPVALSLASCGAGGLLVYIDDELLVAGAALLAFGVLLGLGYLIFESFFIGIFPARCYLRWLRQRIDQRPDAVVTSDNPEAFFVQHIPQKNWAKSFGENASDVGLLLLDHRNSLLKYEGDLERWIVPAESVMSVKLRSFTPPNGIEFLNRHTVVMLRFEVDDDEDVVLRPLAAHPLHWRPWTPGTRKEGAERLREAILHLLNPKEWPRPLEEDLHPLIPPSRELT